MFTVDKIQAVKNSYGDYWTVTADLRSLETFDMYDNNYDIVEKLAENNVLTECEEDSGYAQFFSYFKSKKAADNFLKKLAEYVEERKKIIKSL